jgi:hypothetical protein
MAEKWQRWTRRQWNDALVGVVFGKRPETPPEILRIDATNRFLFAAANAAPEDGTIARKLFLETFPSTRTEFSRLFDTTIQFRTWRSTDLELPFFAQLFLTILVASADEDTFEIGNFRTRLQLLLGFDVSVGHMLNNLPKLWKAAARWTRDTRRENVRRLVLPAPENEVIIGHSKRLAFPAFSDQTKLAKLMTEYGIDASSPEEQIVKAVGNNRNRFSTRFGEEFDEFLRFLRQGERVKAVRCPFWGAVAEINWEARTSKRISRDQEFDLELDVTDPYTGSLTLLARGDLVPTQSWRYQQLPVAVGAMKYAVIGHDRLKQSLLDALLSSSGSNLLAGTRISHWLSRGWIGFCRDDSDRWMASSDLTTSNTLWLLANKSQAVRIDHALRTSKRRPDYTLRGVVSDEWTLFGPLKNNPGLRELLQDVLNDPNSFASRLAAPRIRFIDALSLPEGVLFVPPFLPLVVAESATKIGWMPKSTSGDNSLRWLIEGAESSGSFMFPMTGLSDIPSAGEIEFRAYDEENEEFDRASIHVVTGCLSHSLKRPADETAFLKTGDLGQLIPNGAHALPPVLADRKHSKLVYPIAYRENGSLGTKSVEVSKISESWLRCLEILTAIFVRRACIPAREFFEIVTKIWSSSLRTTWLRIDDMLENGLIERLYHRRWRGSVFVGRSPCAAFLPGTNHRTLRIAGLMPESVLRTLDHLAISRGATCRVISSDDLKVFGAIELEVQHEEVGLSILRDCNIEVCEPRSNHDFVDWGRLLATQTEAIPRALPERWDQSRGRFVQDGEVPAAQVVLERWLFDGAQPLYRLTYEGESWSTRSRLWASLAYKAVSGAPIGYLCSDGSFSLASGVSMPPSFARRNLYDGSGICLRDSAGRRFYPQATHWDMAATLEAWIARPGARKSTALSRYHHALLEHMRRDASEEIHQSSRIWQR